jgi:hypothetical protein
MLLAAARRRVAAWRQPRVAARIARVLWIAWAVIVWNVVFDHVIVIAGRAYIAAAERAAINPAGPFANMDDWMGPAVTRGFWIATVAAGVILCIGLTAVGRGARHARRSADRRLQLLRRAGAPSGTADGLTLHGQRGLARQEQPR